MISYVDDSIPVTTKDTTMAYGSLMNVIAANSVEAKATPSVGEGVTILSWSDRHPGTISRVSASGKTFWYREDNAKCLHEGMTDRQRWEITPDPTAPEVAVRLRKDGTWRELGGRKVLVGVRDRYYDYSF